MIDWTKSYIANWRVFKVNEQTWMDAEKIGGVDTISVTRSCSGDAPMLESGSMSLTGEFERGYYRVVMDAVQGVESERVDIATLLCESNKQTRDFNTVQSSVVCNSVLYPAYTQRLLDGTYIQAGSNVAEFVAKLLGGCIKAPVEVESGFIISSHYWFEFGIRILDAAWEALNIGGYIMQIDGRGVVHIKPRPSTPALSLDSANVALLGTSVGTELDISNVPNRYIAKSDATIAIAVNDDPSSDVSTVSRGYIYDEVDDSPATVDDETLPMYAVRKLVELSTNIASLYSYTREYWPDVYPNDLIEGSIEAVGTTDNLRVLNQSISCGNGITVSEQVAKEVSLWQ